MLTCGNDFVSCGNNFLSCGNKLVSCGNDLLTCGNELVSCRNDLLSCGNNLPTYGNDSVSCENDFLSCITQYYHKSTILQDTKPLSMPKSLFYVYSCIQNFVYFLKRTSVLKQSLVGLYKAAILDRAQLCLPRAHSPQQVSV